MTLVNLKTKRPNYEDFRVNKVVDNIIVGSCNYRFYYLLMVNRPNNFQLHLKIIIIIE